MTGSTYLGEGTHIAMLTDVEMKKTEAGNQMAVLTLKSGMKERKEHIVMTPKTKWKMGQVMSGFGFKPNQEIDFPADVVGKSCNITVAKDGTYKKEDGTVVDRHKVVEWVPVESSTAQNFETDDIPF